MNARLFVTEGPMRKHLRTSGTSAILSTTSARFRNIAEQLIEKGLATAVRHRRDDEDRSPDYDKLMAAEQASVGYLSVLTTN